MTDETWTKAELFAGLSEAELAEVRTALTPVDLPAGREVIVEGEAGDAMFVLVSGSVRVSKSMVLKGISVPVLEAERKGKTLCELSDSQSPFFGEMALLDRDIRSATVSCLTDCHFLRLDRPHFAHLLNEHPAIGVKLVTALARRLARMVRKNNVDLVKLTTALALVLSRRGKAETA